MKIGDQKVLRTLKKQMVRGLLQDKKVPGTSTGTRATAAPDPRLPARPAAGLLGESLVNGTLPCLTGLELHQETCFFEVTGRGTRTKWQTHRDCGRRMGKIESWAVWGPDTGSPRSSQRGGLCERTGPSLYGAAGLSRRIFPKRKRPSGALWGTLLQQQLQSPFHPAARRSL